MAPVGAHPTAWARAPAPRARPTRPTARARGGLAHLVSRGSLAGHPHAGHLPRARPRARDRQVAVASFEDPAAETPTEGGTLTVHYYRHDGAARRSGCTWGTRAARTRRTRRRWRSRNPRRRPPRRAIRVSGPDAVSAAAETPPPPAWAISGPAAAAAEAASAPGDPALASSTAATSSAPRWRT